MRKALALAAAVLFSASAAWSGQFSAGLERLVQGMDGSDEITVLVVLGEQADIRTLNSTLRTTGASMATRHQAVIDELRDTAFRTQGPIVAEMSARSAAGTIRGYTPYWLINAVIVATTVDGARELALRPDVDIVEPNLEVELIEPIEVAPEKMGRGGGRAIGITPGVVAINARQVWELLGIDGTGALVGNMDTGVDGSHPALAARWRGNFAPASECWRDAVGFGDATPVDRHYHGTHVMGTITGQAPDDTIGVAPGALWIADNTINQGAGGAFDSDVLSGLQWFADPDGNPGTLDDVPDVVQHSWGVHEGFSGYVDCDSRWWTAIDNCEAAGVVNTWSAGNEGPGSQSLRSPADRATTPYNCFSVGSTFPTAPFQISDFSSRGPTGCAGTAWPIKPEVSAPGDGIYSAEPGGGYQYLSGTSMAGPHVAGVVALMRAANPDVDVDTIKQILMDTATDLGATGEDNTYGHGFVNAYEAVLAVLDGYGWIEGTVTDMTTGLPIPNAQVDVLGDARETVADAVGFFRLALPAGTWNLEYTAFGYLTDAQPVKVNADLTADGSFGMTAAPAALVSGVVRDYTDALVDGATITVLGTPVAPVLSQPDGTYSISVPDGATYDLRARIDGLGGDTHTVVVAGATIQDFVLPELTSEDFESGDFQIWPWEMSGTLPWQIDTANVYEGTYAAKSGAISHGQASSMEMTLSLVDSGDVTFWYTVSSEATYDFLRFYIDGLQVGSWSGSVPWTQASYPVSNGIHTFRWSYTKDGSVSTGSDAAWVDLIDFPLVGAPAYPELNVSPAQMTATLQPDEMHQSPLTLDNVGDGTLDYSVSVHEAPALRRPAGAAAVPEVGRDPGEIELGKDDHDPRIGQPPLLGSGGPDAFGYNWIDSDEAGGPVYNWVEINGVGTALAMGDDTYSTGHALGFSFPFYGNDYTSVNISTNGVISFSSPGGSYYTNTAIPSPTDPDDIVAALWDDLNANDGGTVYKYQDTANNRFIVEWDGVPHYGGGGSAPQTFQIILNEDGSIVAQYATVSGVDGCTVGIEDAAGTDGLEVVFNAAYLHDGLAIRYSNEPPVSWLSVSPESGSVDPQSSGSVMVLYDTAGMALGIYEAIVRVASNDPNQPVTDVPVTLTVGGTTDVQVTGSPLAFELGAPRPNPSAAATSIGYSVPGAGAEVSIAVFDVSGRQVRTLVNGTVPAGRHVATWDGRDAAGLRVASGVYFYRMDAGEFSQVRKVTVLK